MVLEQALAILVIVVFGIAALWGRTAGGRALLARVFGDPAPTPPRSTRRARRSGSRTAKPGQTKPASRARGGGRGAGKRGGGR